MFEHTPRASPRDTLILPPPMLYYYMRFATTAIFLRRYLMLDFTSRWARDDSAPAYGIAHRHAAMIEV